MRRARRPSAQTLAVLSAIAGDPQRWHHGYDLCRSLDLRAGTVYPILIRLAERGLVETTWERQAPPGRPPRHLYRVSAAGAELVAGLAAQPVGDIRVSGQARRGDWRAAPT
jgi:DNA-binding PadR family transcriptional regulator